MGGARLTKPLRCTALQVDAYFNGHDHDQQHIKAGNEHTHYVISGAGSDTRTHEFSSIHTGPETNLLFADTHQGFVSVGLSNTEMVVSYYTSATGVEPAHVFTVKPQ